MNYSTIANAAFAFLVLGAALGLATIRAVQAQEAESTEEEKEYEADQGAETIDVSSYAPEQQAAYALFASKCSKCHTLARPINTDKSAEQWARYVQRMANKPKSNISPEQAKQIYLFIKFYQSQKDAAKAASSGD